MPGEAALHGCYLGGGINALILAFDYLQKIIPFPAWPAIGHQIMGTVFVLWLHSLARPVIVGNHAAKRKIVLMH